MRTLTLLALSLSAWAANPPDVNAVVRKALSSEIARQQKLANYTWEETTIEKTFDQKGKSLGSHTKTFENLILDGSEYRRLVQEDGKPLSADRARKEQEKMDREIAKRKAESESQRRHRVEEQAKKRQEAVRFREEVLSAFNFSLAGEESIKGVDSWKVQAEPKRGFVGQSRQGKMVLGKIHGSMWISKSDSDLLKIDAETIDKITFGGFLASLSAGSHIGLEMMRVNSELWHPETISIGINARALWKRVNVEVEVAFRNFRKFKTESKLIAED